MDNVGNLFHEYPKEIAAVRQYLHAALPNAELASSEDFNRDGICFRIEPRRLVFISHEFLSDFTTEVAAAHLRAWHVAEKAKSLPVGAMLFVTTEGTFVERLR